MDKQFVLRNLRSLSLSAIARAICDGIVSFEEIVKMNLLEGEVLAELAENIKEFDELEFYDRDFDFLGPKGTSNPDVFLPLPTSNDADVYVFRKIVFNRNIASTRNIAFPSPDSSPLKIQRNSPVYSALYAPASAQCAKWIRIQVHLYNEEDAKLSLRKATSLDQLTALMEYNPLSLQIQAGTQVKAELTLYDTGLMATVPRTTHILTWNGALTSAIFQVKIVDPSLTSLAGEVMLSVEDIPVGILSFTTEIEVSGDGDAEERPGRSKSFKKVFVSYSHKDVWTAETVAATLRAQNISYFFDHHSLESGSVFNEEIRKSIDESDLFILLWSENAAQSDYVEKEYLHALRRAYPQVQRQDASIEFRPYFIDPIADPPEVLKNIYNFASIHAGQCLPQN